MYKTQPYWLNKSQEIETDDLELARTLHQQPMVEATYISSGLPL